MSQQHSLEQEEYLLVRDREFFAALIENDLAALEEILADDFTLLDLRGGQMTKDQFLSVLKDGQIKFVSIEPQSGSRVRLYGTAAAVTGRTLMELQFLGQDVSVESRYTHLFAEDAGRWRLEIAQGTPVQ